MDDNAGRWTAEHTVIDKNLEIGELKHLLEQRDKIISDLTKKVKELETKLSQLTSKDYPNEDVDYSIAEEESEEEDERNKLEEKQLSFEFH